MNSIPSAAQESASLVLQTYARLHELVLALDAAPRFEFLSRGFAMSASARRDSETAMQERLLWQVLGDTPLDGRALLDAGCGRGGALAAMARARSPGALSGIDLSPQQIAACRLGHRGLAARWEVADACRLPQAAASQDVVLAIELLEELCAPPLFLHDAARVLRAGGHLVLSGMHSPQAWEEVIAAAAACGLQLEARKDLSNGVLAAAIWRQRRQQEQLMQGGSAESFLRSLLCEELAAGQAALKSGALCYQALRFVRGSDPLPQRAPEWRPAPPLCHVRGSEDSMPQGETDDAAAVFPFGAPHAAGPMPVFAFPFAGSGASAFAGWRECLASRLQFCPIQLPGREGYRMDAPLYGMRAWVEWSRAQIEPLLRARPAQPYALFGHGLGGALAHELGLALSANGQAPSALWLSAAKPPPLPPAFILLRLLPLAPFGRGDLASLARMPDSAVAGLLAAPEAMRAMRQTMQADFAAGAHYPRFGRGTPGCPIHTLSGEPGELLPLAA